MIIVLEGPDGSGKTTLARQLAERYHLHYHHEGVPPVDVPPLLWYGAVIEQRRRGCWVFDRLALGERVYGPIVRGRDRFGDDGWRVMQRLLRAVGAVQVLCLPAYDVCYAAWASGREELLTDEDAFRRSYDSYSAYAYTQDLVYDYTCDTVARFDEVYTRPRPQLLPGIVGSPTASFLLVGDVGSDPTALVDLPFFATSGSSGYLTTALDEAGFTEDEVAFVNAHRHDGQQVLLPQLPVVIALGQRAAAACRTQALEFVQVPHPQFWKRFHHHDLAGYAKLLRRCRAVRG